MTDSRAEFHREAAHAYRVLKRYAAWAPPLPPAIEVIVARIRRAFLDSRREARRKP